MKNDVRSIMLLVVSCEIRGPNMDFIIKRGPGSPYPEDEQLCIVPLGDLFDHDQRTMLNFEKDLYLLVHEFTDWRNKLHLIGMIERKKYSLVESLTNLGKKYNAKITHTYRTNIYETVLHVEIETPYFTGWELIYFKDIVMRPKRLKVNRRGFEKVYGYYIRSSEIPI